MIGEHVVEVIHDVGEESYTSEHHNDDNYAFLVGNWDHVTESHCGEGCHDEVAVDDNLLPIRHEVQPVFRDEIGTFEVCFVLWDHQEVPEASDEVSETEASQDELDVAVDV